MRGLKSRSADTIADWSLDVATSPVAGGVRAQLLALTAATLPLAGGTMTGPLLLAANAATGLNPVPLQQANTLIAAAIAALIAGAPSGLDTLAEISNSINNDPNFYTSILALLNTRAALTGATFTGPVSVPSNTTLPNATVTLSNVQNLIAAAGGGGGGETLTPVSSTRLVKTLLSGSSFSLDLAASGVAIGTYPKVTVDLYGRVIAGSTLQEVDLASISVNAYSTHAAAVYTIGSIVNQLAGEVAALQGSSGTGNGHEDTFTGNGTNTVFVWVNVVGSRVSTAPKRILIFIDGLRQPISSYTLSSTGVSFSTAPVINAEIEVLQID